MDSEVSSGEEINAAPDAVRLWLLRWISCMKFKRLIKQREESKSNIGKAGFGSRKLMHDPRMRNKRKPPRGMHLSVESIKSVAKGPFTQRHSVLKKLDLGFVNLRRQVVLLQHLQSLSWYSILILDFLQVQQNKQAISALIEKSKGGLGDSRLPEVCELLNSAKMQLNLSNHLRHY